MPSPVDAQATSQADVWVPVTTSDRTPGLWQLIREDWEANGRVWTEPGFRAVAVHRFGVWALRQRPVIRAPLFRLYVTLFRWVRNHYGIELPWMTRVGQRFRIGHQGGIVIHPRAQIGDDCCIRQNVTIGAATADRSSEAPTLGDRVEVGAGAVIIGRITIGDDVRIGPNAVVMTNVPAGSTAFAAPARIIPRRDAPVANGVGHA
jgi:serine O-acetyltransferase